MTRPSWFNEGLASLYEQSSTKNGRIHGKINWRYKALEQAIKDRKLISFQELTATSDEAFYGGANNPDYSQHYAQARYLCYYLQEMTEFRRPARPYARFLEAVDLLVHFLIEETARRSGYA